MKEIIITSSSSNKLIDFEELWRYRELLYIFAWRDIKVRYKQTLLGVLWVIFQPLVTMVIFTIFFGNIARIPSSDMPYSLFVLCGLIYWTFFSSILTHSSDSLIINEGIIKKIYFPKIVLPLSSFITSLVDFSINFLLLIFYALVLGYTPSLLILLILPYGIIISALTAIGIGLILSSLNVRYRDVRYILPFFIQILLFLTPVIYPTLIMSERNKFFMAFNPITSVIEVTRVIFSSNYAFKSEYLLLSSFLAIFTLIIGLWYFKRTEHFIADIV